jgi:hypothetical protein
MRRDEDHLFCLSALRLLPQIALPLLPLHHNLYIPPLQADPKAAHKLLWKPAGIDEVPHLCMALYAAAG